MSTTSSCCWIDDELVDFGDSTYEADEVFGSRSEIIPRSDGTDGDLSPVGVGARGASLTVDRLQVLRDIYYVAVDSRKQNRRDQGMPEYGRLASWAQLPDGTQLPPVESLQQFFSDPDTWQRFANRRKCPFTVTDEQYFVCGDNSPESKDCRLWAGEPEDKKMQVGGPGGAYLDRRLLTGKAICVFWPHSWGGIPGLEKLPASQISAICG